MKDPVKKLEKEFKALVSRRKKLDKDLNVHIAKTKKLLRKLQ